MGRKLTFTQNFMCKRGWHKWKKSYPIYVKHVSPAEKCGDGYECIICGASGHHFFEDLYKRIKTTSSPFWDSQSACTK